MSERNLKVMSKKSGTFFEPHPDCWIEEIQDSMIGGAVLSYA